MFLTPSPSVFCYRVTEENKFNLTAKTNHFSDENIHFPGNSHRQLQENITLIIYANGSCDENKGYVSAFINVPKNSRFLGEPSIFKIRCIMSLIDVTGKQRYTKTLVATNHFRNEIDNFPSFGFSKFKERKKLLDEKSELLPNDTMTLLFDIHTSEDIYSRDTAYYSLGHVIWSALAFEDGRHRLCLDSELVKMFSEVTEYFKRMLETDTVESRTGWMTLPVDEFRSFECLSWLVLSCSSREETVMFLLDLEDIFRLYDVAKRYLITFAVEKCREFLQSIMSSGNESEISSFAKLHNDKDLEETANFFQPSTQDFDILYEGRRQLVNNKHPLFPNPLSDETVKNERSDFKFYQ